MDTLLLLTGMINEDGAKSVVAIERGGIYEHETHGRVEVVGIWNGIQSVDEAGNIDGDRGPRVVCYAIREQNHPVGELSETLDSFLDAIESTD